jgi:hypothetical protein
VRRVAQGNAIAADVAGSEGAIVDQVHDLFLALRHGEGQRLRPLLGDLRIQVVLDFLVGDDVAEGVRNMGITRYGALLLAVVVDGFALVLDRRQAETSDFDIFLVRLIGALLVEEVRELFRVFGVRPTPPGVNAGP